jgi:hypothetical protein
MKKDKGIKIIKEKIFTNNNYTFIDDANISKYTYVSSMDINDHNDEFTFKIANSKEDKYKKKKIANKNESKNKFNKALKFSNPSQRNHSSVYE